MSNRLPVAASAAILLLTMTPLAPHLDAGGVSFANAAYAQGRGNDGDDNRGRGNDEDRGRGNEERGGGNDNRGGGNANDNRGPGANAGPGNNDPKFAAAEERVRDAANQGRRGRDLTNDDIDALIAGGWGNRALDDGFRNHGERVRTYVAIAKALGEGAYVGALQANFGPVTATQPLPTNPRPPGDWATINLDVNKDGVIDGRDLLAAEAAPRPPAPRAN
jgi:hypothetical protein